MQRRPLGNSALEVSAIGLGCMPMSSGYGPSDDRAALATLHRALDLGIIFLDTADLYGGGHNERLIGQAIASRREEVVLASKFGQVPQGDGSVRAEVHQDVARLSGSVRIPKLPLKSYLNFGFSVSDIGGEPRVSDLHVGQVPVPDRIAQLAMREALDRLLRTEQGEIANDVIKDMNLSAGRIAITYLWRPDLIGRPIQSGDALSNANTIIQMGKIRDGTTMGRALHVAKHRGSACDDGIVPFEITGLLLLAATIGAIVLAKRRL